MKTGYSSLPFHRVSEEFIQFPLVMADEEPSYRFSTTLTLCLFPTQISSLTKICNNSLLLFTFLGTAHSCGVMRLGILLNLCLSNITSESSRRSAKTESVGHYTQSF